ncbi:MAG: hypothetical protein LAT82_03265 [Nanoarchaeota archaeon]|nr:hypothetical protein [Nanoarchaeota archaeon]
MAKVVVKQKIKKIKRKFPIEFIAPEIFNSKVIGQANVSDLNKTVGKTIKINMMYVADSVKFQNIRLTFKVMEVDSGKGKTEVSNYEQVPYFLSRFIKKDSDLVEVNEYVTTKDNKEVLVKLFIVTKHNESQLVLREIRAQARDLVKKEAIDMTYNDFISNIVYSKIQQKIRNELKKITPVKVFEFKKTELIMKSEE